MDIKLFYETFTDDDNSITSTRKVPKSADSSDDENEPTVNRINNKIDINGNDVKRILDPMLTPPPVPLEPLLPVAAFNIQFGNNGMVILQSNYGRTQPKLQGVVKQRKNVTTLGKPKHINGVKTPVDLLCTAVNVKQNEPAKVFRTISKPPSAKDTNKSRFGSSWVLVPTTIPQYPVELRMVQYGSSMFKYEFVMEKFVPRSGDVVVRRNDGRPERPPAGWCIECALSFSRKSSVIRHMNNAHNTRDIKMTEVHYIETNE